MSKKEDFVKFDKVDKSYDGKVLVVKDLNLKLKYSENVILIGPNGSGKSSLLELINRNIYPVIRKDTVFKIFNKEL